MATVLITGANRGLGLEFVKQYAADEWAVIAVCRHPEKADELQKLMQKYNRVRIEGVDVTDAHSVNILREKLADTEIDVLINNAGVFTGGTVSGSATKIDMGQNFGTINADEWASVLRTNTIAPVMLTEALLTNLQRSKEAKVINITSRMGSIDEMGPSYIAYRTSKAALNAAMRVIAHDLKTKYVTIVNMHPGWVKTDMGGQEAPLEPPDSIKGMRKV
ncbi:MAG TPA: SDR family oxidoreductase, partial [Alphaproteobacteria bacterium]|nr:SDR family oxidoreductase [Alphaproteobacteria bacterium]